MAKYLRNCWYAAAYSEDITRDPFARTILDEPLVLYRKRDGSPVILSDTCPHRFAPMSEGVVIDDDIRCGYHGLRFNGDGICTDNPHNPDLIPRAACLQSYPVLEKYGFIWIWPGAKEKVDEGLLPDFYYLNNPQNFRALNGYLHVEGNYQLVVDNLLDLTHAPYLHPQFAMPGVDIEKQLKKTESKLIRHEKSVTAYRLRSGLPPNQATIDLFDFSNDPVDTRSHMHWYPPAVIDFDNGTCLEGTPEEEGFCFPQAHAITPETEITSHYFFAAARNLKLDDESVDEAIANLLDQAFRTQDEPMIRRIQQRMGPSGDLNSLNPVYLSTDGAPVAARRMLEKMINDEIE
jgi:phenylpropionate dioxygenase-like ring-hydroxylating dioxygenase large terminal subunit